MARFSVIHESSYRAVDLCIEIRYLAYAHRRDAEDAEKHGELHLWMAKLPRQGSPFRMTFREPLRLCGELSHYLLLKGERA